MSLKYKLNCNVNLDLPYPPIKTDSRNLEDAYSMLSKVGSSNSEMCAVSLYFYNSVILKPEYADFAECFHKISIVEMHHLDIYSSLACQMGLDPRLWSVDDKKVRYWTPAYNQYPQGIRDLIENSLNSELAAIHKYTRQAETIEDPDIVKILKRIILDEQHHVEIFHEMLDHLD